MAEESVHPGAHHLREREEADRMAARRGIEDDEFERVAGRGHQLGDAFQQGRFAGAWRKACQIRADGRSPRRAAGGPAASCGASPCRCVARPRRPDRSPGRQGSARASSPCRRSHAQRCPPGNGRGRSTRRDSAGHGPRRRRPGRPRPSSCRRRLCHRRTRCGARTGSARARRRQQQRKWSRGECSRPMRVCQSWNRSSSTG